MYLQTFFPLIFTTYTYQIVNMQFGMYLWITTAFFHTENTYHFVNYQFGMYLQTNFPINLLFHTYQIANTPVWYVFYRYFWKQSSIHATKTTQSTSLHLTFPRLPRRPYGLLAMTIFQKSSLFIQKFTSLTTSFPPHNAPSP